MGAERPESEYVTDEANLLHDIRDLLTEIRDLLVEQHEVDALPPTLRPFAGRWPGEYHDSDPDK